MPCDTIRQPNQTITERKLEIKEAVEKLQRDLVSGAAKAKVGPQGAITFTGTALVEGRVTDACAYRRIMVSGGALAKAAITRAEQMAGRSVDKLVVGQGIHSHDGGQSWHQKG